MSNSGLIVRRSVRFEVSMPARVRVASHHAEVLNFVKGVCDENRWINIDLIDFGSGGLGFIAPVYLPRNAHLEVQVPDFQNPAGRILLECCLCVERIQMTDRRPAYQVGCSFQDLKESEVTQIDVMIDRLSGLIESDSNGEDDAGYL